MEKVIEHGVVVGLANHTVLQRSDGSLIPIDDSAAVIRDAKGRASGAVMAFRDIRQRRLSEDALRNAEEQLRIPKCELGLIAITMVMRLSTGKDDQRGEIHGNDERHDGDGEIENEELRFAAGLVLLREKIHVR